MDPRNPKRPEGDAGSNWVRCRECGRQAHQIKLIRHVQGCRAANPAKQTHTLIKRIWDTLGA